MERRLAETFPDDCIKAGTAWQIMAWLMVPIISLQKALLLLGPGGTGKSVFLSVLQCFLGKRRNTCSIPLQKLEQDRFAVARLVGKLACIYADLADKELETTAVFRALTGGGEDYLPAEHKFKDSFDYAAFARRVYSANKPPKAKDATEAFFERWWVLPMDKIYRGTNKEIDFKKLVAMLTTPEELSGMLNLALDALPDVLKRGVVVTESMRLAHEEFESATDPFLIWVRKTIVERRGGVVPKAWVWDRYQKDMEATGNSASSQKLFYNKFSRLFNPGGKENRRIMKDFPNPDPDKADKPWNPECYLNIALTESGDQDD